MGFPGTFEMILILCVLVLIFGGRKLPEIGAAMGKAITNFRKSLHGKDAIDVTPKDSEDKNTDP